MTIYSIIRYKFILLSLLLVFVVSSCSKDEDAAAKFYVDKFNLPAQDALQYLLAI